MKPRRPLLRFSNETGRPVAQRACGAATSALLIAARAGAAAAPHYELDAEASVATPLGDFADHAPRSGSESGSVAASGWLACPRDVKG